MTRVDEGPTVESTALDPPARSYDDLRYRVFMAFARSTAAFSGLMVLLESYVRGPLAPQTLAFVVATVLFAGLSGYVSKTRQTKGATILALGVYVVLFALIEAASPVVAVGIRVATFAFPVAVILLAGRRAALAFYVAAIVQSVVLLKLEGDQSRDMLTILHVVGAVFVGGILVATAWTFDHARQRAMDLAEEREKALRVALKRAEAAAEARSNFLANMSHEIRTPMNGVLGLSRLLVEEPLSDSQRELAETVVSSGQSLLHVLDDILDLSKLDAGALLIDPKPERPETIARQVVALLAVQAEERGLFMELEVAPDLPPWVHVDGHRLRQVLTNLVGNALKFTSAGGVRIRMTSADQTLRLEVEDTGIGLSDSQMDGLFMPFVQADSTTARRFGGTGLGLAICKRLCELMGGQIGVRSELDVGSVFWFELPAPPTDAPADDSTNADEPLGRLRVLVAEDNKVNQLVVRRFLRQLGVESKVVDDGAAALEVIQNETYDLVLMDRHMPVVDGIEATRRIRRLTGAQSQTPIVALTASVMAQDRADCLEAGMNAVLPKPIEISTLERALRAHARPSPQA